ncbi:MAG TPA: thermonuclease family protein [Nitrososphaeraceae archaeon]|nr:thermonuclease family protein [Nitrososphaeraceae archaeon]
MSIRIIIVFTITLVFLFSLTIFVNSQGQLFPIERNIQEDSEIPIKNIRTNTSINVDKDDNEKQDEEEEEKNGPTLPKPTLSDEIELAGKVNYVVDGDTLDINDIRIRLSLVDTPERGQDGYQEAKNFVTNVCLNKKGEVDIDDGQRRGDRYGREVGVVYCDGINLNKALMENNLARIYREYCDISEFKNEKWAKPYC